jgi:putative GTP pyrophosphokinase
MTEEELTQLNRFLSAYAGYVQDQLQPAQTEIMAVLDQWRQPDHWKKYKKANTVPIPTPVRTVFSRIKRPEQVVDKLYRKAPLYPRGLHPDSFHIMYDALGVRLLVYFLSHLPLIDREIQSSPELEISTVKPPVAYMSREQAKLLSLGHLHHLEKGSGYESLHYILRLKKKPEAERENPWFELQVRTLSQELWCVTEHHMGYKPGKRPNLAAMRQFKVLSKMLGAIDEQLNLMYEEMNRFQEETSYESQDPLNPENIPSVLDEFGLNCAQRDINNILKLLYSRGVETVQALRDIATPQRLEIIHNTYLSVLGRPPVSLEVAATLAALKGADDHQEEVKRIKSQIAYRGAWDSIRQEIGKESE